MFKTLFGCKADRVTPKQDSGSFSTVEAIRINSNISNKLSKKDPTIDEFNFHSPIRNVFNLR